MTGVCLVVVTKRLSFLLTEAIISQPTFTKKPYEMEIDAVKLQANCLTSSQRTHCRIGLQSRHMNNWLETLIYGSHIISQVTCHISKYSTFSTQHQTLSPVHRHKHNTQRQALQLRLLPSYASSSATNLVTFQLH